MGKPAVGRECIVDSQHCNIGLMSLWQTGLVPSDHVAQLELDCNSISPDSTEDLYCN